MSSVFDAAQRFSGGLSISLRDAVQAVLGAALAVQAARLVWIVATPLGPFGAAPPPEPAAAPDLAVLDRFDPFFRAPAAVAPAADAGGFRLFGVRSGASAILAGPDGRQAAYRIGEEVAPGVVLRSVGVDHAVLSAGGRRSTVAFAPLSGGGAYAPPPPPEPPVQPSGYVVPPGGAEAQALGRVGLLPGDRIITVDGVAVQDLGPDQAAALQKQFSGGGQAFVQFERDGQVRTATLGSPQP